jgi:hypothetical protein
MLFYKSSQKLLDHQGLGQVTHWSGLIHLQADSVVFPLRQRLGIHLTPMSPGEFTMEDVDFIGKDTKSYGKSPFIIEIN